MTLQPGMRLGPYEVQAAIGAGGTGEVHKARDTRLDRGVAINVLPAPLTTARRGGVVTRVGEGPGGPQLAKRHESQCESGTVFRPWFEELKAKVPAGR